MKLDVGEMVKGIQQRLPFLSAPERVVSELLDMLRDAHRIMLRLEETMDRFDKMAQSWDERIESIPISAERIDRIEQALFNIERGMMGVEASMSALPRALRVRIDRGRKPIAGDSPTAPRRPY
jgi:Mg2+/Co2+ transporter CorC